MRNFIQDGHTLVLRALRKLIETGSSAGATSDAPLLIIEEIATRDWASLTFTGTLHRIDVRLEGAAAAVAAAAGRIERELPEIESSMPGHLLAQAAVSACVIEELPDGRRAARLVIDALTLDE